MLFMNGSKLLNPLRPSTSTTAQNEHIHTPRSYVWIMALRERERESQIDFLHAELFKSILVQRKTQNNACRGRIMPISNRNPQIESYTQKRVPLASLSMDSNTPESQAKPSYKKKIYIFGTLEGIHQKKE